MLPSHPPEGSIVTKGKFEENKLILFVILQFHSYFVLHRYLKYNQSILVLFPFFVEKRLVLTIEPEDYITKNGAGGSIKLYVKGDVEETGQSFATQDVVELTKPTLNVTVSSVAKDNN